jgi:ribosomal-protein-alanine N-acetyltransferase|tara:strand:- start:126493 stop:126969 length:477 start_codon:yes stop_codon:yes gene_type:complete
MTMQFRPATARDTLLLASLAREAFDPMFGEGWSSSQLTGTLSQPHAWSEIASRNDTPLGFTLSRIAADEAELLLVAVHPKERGQGLGRELLLRAAGHAVNNGARFMHLEVRKNNLPALNIYRAAGFCEVGQRTAYYRGMDGHAHDAVTMKRELPIISA